ncbi:hypothetical protein REPUB_Repub11eG0029300 [Reevesia pubescens]
MGNSELQDWEYLPELCLFTILGKLDGPSNQVQFGAVSRHWHSVFNSFLDIKRRSCPNLVPMLLIPTKKSEKRRKLYSLQTKAKVSNIELPMPYTRRFCGSCYGWLATVDENMFITLLNPFQDGISIHLPQFKLYDIPPAGYQYEIVKVVLSTDPLLHPDSYVVMVIYSVYCRLAIYKSWQKNWIYMDQDLKLSDVIFYRNLVYIIGHWNNFVSFDVNDKSSTTSPKLKILKPRDPVSKSNCSNRIYLVESSKGNLYSIHKHLDFEKEVHIAAHFTKKFRVFKWVLDDQTGELLEKKEVKSLDGDIVFVGDNGTLAVSSLVFPQGQPNSIYYTDDYFDIVPYQPFGAREIGIFNLKDESFGLLGNITNSNLHIRAFLPTFGSSYPLNLSRCC